jgi:hypothetical protein
MISWDRLVTDISDEVRGLKKGSARFEAVSTLSRSASLGYYTSDTEVPDGVQVDDENDDDVNDHQCDVRDHLIDKDPLYVNLGARYSSQYDTIQSLFGIRKQKVMKHDIMIGI